MKRLIILLLLLIILGASYFFLDKSEDEQMTALKSERSFAITDIDDLYKIIITERNKKSVILAKQDDKSWLLNDQYLARENAIKNLLEVIKHVQIKYIPENAAVENIINEIRTIGIQIDLYQKDNSLIKSYQVGGSTQDERGTYFLMDNAKQPFVVQIPSIEGSVRGRFIHSVTDWRDRAVFKEEVANLKYINVDYTSQPKESFKIHLLSENKFEVFDFMGDRVNQDDNKVRAYVDGYEEVYAEYIDNNNPMRDSISSLVPFATISFGQSNTSLKTIKLYPLSDLLYEKETEEKELDEVNALKIEGRYFADCSWGDFMLVQHRLIGKLLRGKSFFEPK